ncbi:Uncharacterized protein OBRU01_15531, partial [Operophtera brumata]
QRRVQVVTRLRSPEGRCRTAGSRPPRLKERSTSSTMPHAPPPGSTLEYQEIMARQASSIVSSLANSAGAVANSDLPLDPFLSGLTDHQRQESADSGLGMAGPHSYSMPHTPEDFLATMDDRMDCTSEAGAMDSAEISQTIYCWMTSSRLSTPRVTNRKTCSLGCRRAIALLPARRRVLTDAPTISYKHAYLAVDVLRVYLPTRRM